MNIILTGVPGIGKMELISPDFKAMIVGALSDGGPERD